MPILPPVPKHLVIVESPAKARTIERYLGSDYSVLASYGHVRDLPDNPGKGKFGVDVDNGFEPEYVVSEDRRKHVADIEKAAKSADTVYLATDLDREGEAIAWHVTEAAHVAKSKTRRVTFSEITERAIKDAFANPRAIDVNLVDAQQARRIVDRLVGYTLSPLISRKVRSGLSAGRVQSVAVRLVVEREREIDAFVAREYWTLRALLATERGDEFEAELVKIDGKALEVGDGETADRHAEALRGLRPEVRSIATKTQKRSPAPPFTTSTLQQEASRKLSFSPKRTMSIAQRLYEGVDTPDGHVGPDHVHANRLGGDRRGRDGRGARRHPGALRRALHDAQGPGLQDEVEGRPGGARVGPADVVPPRPGLDGQVPEAGGAPALPAHLAAGPREPDGGQGARDDDGRAHRRPVRAASFRDAGRCSMASPGSTRKVATTAAPRTPPMPATTPLLQPTRTRRAGCPR